MLRGTVGMVNTRMATDCSFQYGGSIVLTKAWAKSLLSRMGFVKCKGSTSVKLRVPEFEKHKEHHIIAYYLFLNLLGRFRFLHLIT